MKNLYLLVATLCITLSCAGMEQPSKTGAPEQQKLIDVAAEEIAPDDSRHKQFSRLNCMQITNFLCCPCINILTCCAGCIKNCEGKENSR